MMRTLTRCPGLLGLLTIGAVPCAAFAQQRTPANSPLMLDAVTVVDVEHGKLVPNQRVAIAGHRIQAVGATRSIKVPKGAKVVNARGKYLIPGLWDLHVHVPSQGWADLYYPLLLANGITGIRDAGVSRPYDSARIERREILAGTRLGPPRQILSGPPLSDNSPCTGVAFQDCAVWVRRLMDSLQSTGVEMIKTYGLSRPMYFLVAAEARRRGLPFGGHFPSVPVTEAVDSGATILDHVWGADYAPESGGMDTLCWGPAGSVARCRPIVEQMRRHHAWAVPTLIVASYFGVDQHKVQRSRALVERMTACSRRFWVDSLCPVNWLRDAAAGNAAAGAPAASTTPGIMQVAHELDLPILAGTDAVFVKETPPGFMLHAELASYVTEGLTPLEALRTATLNPAKFLRGTDSLGTVSAGKLADLVLLDADPLADITNTTTIRAVVADGRYYERAALDRILAGVRAENKRRSR